VKEAEEYVWVDGKLEGVGERLILSQRRKERETSEGERGRVRMRGKIPQGWIKKGKSKKYLKNQNWWDVAAAAWSNERDSFEENPSEVWQRVFSLTSEGHLPKREKKLEQKKYDN
jgi:hypothetical protein